MKAILLTRCGCSRMVNVDPATREYRVPLIPHYTLGLFRDEEEGGPATWTATESRLFVREKADVQPFGNEFYAVFREKP